MPLFHKKIARMFLARCITRGKSLVYVIKNHSIFRFICLIEMQWWKESIGHGSKLKGFLAHICADLTDLTQ